MTPERLGPYRIERLLGQGGMGSVYLATHDESGQQAAVKILSSSLSRDEDFRERFAGEIESLKKLRHPNIVQLFGWGEQDGMLFYAMEAIDGKSLQERLAGSERVEWREAIQIGIDVCKALKHAHDSGIIHRDLKPANLLTDPNGRVKLTDFGIAKLFGYTQLTAEGGVVGTADYMAPEQALGQPVNHRCDLYSLGSVLFTLLSGRPPFLSKSMPEVVHKVCYEPPQPVRRFNASVPPQLESLIGELLEKDAAKRPPTARSVTTRLESMQHGLTEPRKVPPAGGDDTDFDYSEPGATAAPGQPQVHSATTRFAPAEGEPPPAGQTSTGETVRGDEVRPSDSFTQAPARDATVGNDAGRPASGVNGKTSSSEEKGETAASFTTLEEAAEDIAMERRSELRAQRWIIGTMVLALLGIIAFVAWQILVPPAADDLYANIQATADQNPDNLSRAEGDIVRFLELYPNDDRVSELRALLDEIDLERKQKNFERRGRRPGATAELTPLERAYFEAVDLGRTQPQLAIDRLQAIVDLYGDGDDSAATREIVELAQRQKELLQASLAEAGERHVEQLQERLRQAERLEQSDPEQARAMYHGLVLLYDGQRWADETVATAKRRLAALEAAAE